METVLIGNSIKAPQVGGVLVMNYDKENCTYMSRGSSLSLFSFPKSCVKFMFFVWSVVA